jgi:hypothetical protein
VVLGQSHLENIVSGSEGLKNILVVNDLFLESLVCGFDWDLFASPLSLEGGVVPVDEFILSLGDLLSNAFSGFSVCLGLNN